MPARGEAFRTPCGAFWAPGADTVVLRDDSRGRWLRFQGAREIVRADRLAQVLPALEKIEQSVGAGGIHAAGFIAYEAAPAFDSALVAHESHDSPLVWFGIYEDVEEVRLPEPVNDPLPPADRWEPSVMPEPYRVAVERVRAYIRNGDTYQANYTYRLRASFGAEPWQFFLRLAGATPPPFAAYVQTADWAIASASPELFLDLRDGWIRSRPMKGTAPRGRTLSEDRERARALEASAKERAENLMITDMVRNDLGRIAAAGTVVVDRLFDIEKYPTVWQMTSTVSARTDAGLTEILRATFPPASITGAPKARTTEIIAELETAPRGVYTGAIGFIGPGRRMQLNVAIRTAWINLRRRRAEYGVGGGIVWDSRPELELEECRAKARVLSHPPVRFSLLETILWTPEGGYALLDRHLARLADSAEYFDYRLDLQAVGRELDRLAESLPPRSHRVRLLLAHDGKTRAEASSIDLGSDGAPRRVCLASAPVDSSDPFLYHKTTNRRVYDRALAARPGFDDVILWNGRGEITESCIANVVVEIEGRRFTPPVDCGLLGGTYRGWMLETGAVAERTITIEELRGSPRVLLVNSVRGETEVQFAASPAADAIGTPAARWDAP